MLSTAAAECMTRAPVGCNQGMNQLRTPALEAAGASISKDVLNGDRQHFSKSLLVDAGLAEGMTARLAGGGALACICLGCTGMSMPA